VIYHSYDFGALGGLAGADRGYYCCYSAFPAVPMDRPSLRFTLSRHNSLAEVERFVETLADVIAPRARLAAAVAVAI